MAVEVMTRPPYCSVTRDGVTVELVRGLDGPLAFRVVTAHGERVAFFNYEDAESLHEALGVLLSPRAGGA